MPKAIKNVNKTQICLSFAGQNLHNAFQNKDLLDSDIKEKNDFKDIVFRPYI
jgi:hypothetical protein